MIGISYRSVYFCKLGVLSVLPLHVLAPLGVIFAREGATVLFQGSELLREQLLAGQRLEHAFICVDFRVKLLFAALTAGLSPG